MVPCLLRNGVKFCEVIEAGNPLRPDDEGTMVFLTTERVLPSPGDAFVFASPDIQFPVTILQSRIEVSGWRTICVIADRSPAS